jgi:hypothetical protein
MLERSSRYRRAGQLVAAFLMIAASREATSQPITPGRPREPETIPLFPRPTTTPRDVLEAPLAMRDAELGLGMGGQIVADVNRLALEQAPRDGRGIMRIFVDENGRVADVTSTSRSWDRAALTLRRELEGRRFELPRGVRTVTLSFSVEARSTSDPAIFTGEESQSPASWPPAVQGRSPSDAPAPVVLVPVESLLPVARHIVNVALLRIEQR